MQIRIFDDKPTLGRTAAEHAAQSLRVCIQKQGSARLVAATGASQFEFLEALTTTPGIDWSSVEVFHLDEYVGLPVSHPASFRKYILERLVHKTGITKYHLLDGEKHPGAVAKEVGAEIAQKGRGPAICWHRRERTPCIQRSAGGFPDGGTLSGSGIGSGLPAAASR